MRSPEREATTEGVPLVLEAPSHGVPAHLVFLPLVARTNWVGS